MTWYLYRFRSSLEIHFTNTFHLIYYKTMTMFAHGNRNMNRVDFYTELIGWHCLGAERLLLIAR